MYQHESSNAMNVPLSPASPASSLPRLHPHQSKKERQAPKKDPVSPSPNPKPINLVLLQESWLYEDIENTELENLFSGMTARHAARKTRKGGGALILVSQSAVTSKAMSRN